MRHIIPVDFSFFPPDAFKGLRLAGPGTDTGIESAFFILSNVPPGCGGPKLHMHPVDQLYYVMSGTMKVQLGTDVFVVHPETLVYIPAGTPHCNWNEGTEPEYHLEVFAYKPDLAALLEFTEPRKIPNADKLIRPLKDNEWIRKPGFSMNRLLTRGNGGSGKAQFYVAETTKGGGGGGGLHIHDFDQFYYILEGTLTIQIGRKRIDVGPHNLVLLPAGIVHANINERDELERHLTIIVPEPEGDVRYDHRMKFVD
jgi:mannose-6-phosphate isomerase-like protein (cupin superfamily)